MSNVTSSAVGFEAIKNLQIVETVLLLAGSVFLQFIIHLIPSTGTPLGAVLLAMFYAPLIAIIFFRIHVALVVGLLSPIINYLVTGAPKAELLTLMTVELVVFTVLLYFFLNINGIKKISALLAVLIALLISPSILSLIDIAQTNNIIQSITLAVPGIAILSLLNYFLLRYKE